MAELERWMHIPNAAKYAGVTQHFIRQRIKNKTLKAARAGRWWVIDRYDLDAMLEQIKNRDHKH